MVLNLKPFSQLIEDMGAALQSSASSLIDVSVGSVVRAIFEANASVVLWLQWLIIRVLQSTRASTSTGADLDSWMADFGLTRLLAAPSNGIVMFSRFASNLPASIPVGTVVKTSDGSLTFSVVADPSISTWQASSSTYLIPSGVASVDVPVVCTVGGAVGNVLGNTITVIAASLPGVDQVNNTNPFADGYDSESDVGFRTRFQNYLISRSRATLLAVQNAIATVQQGLSVTIEQNTAPDGTSQVGSFLVIIDDGSGYPSASLLSNVAAAVDSVRPIATRFAVISPQVLTVNVSMTADLTSQATASSDISNIENYVAIYLNTLAIGKSASVTRVAQNAYLAGSNIENVTAIQLNGTSADILPPPLSVIKAGQVVVTANGG